MELIIDGIDQECGRTYNVGFRTQGDPEVAVTQATKDLIQIQAFNYHGGRLGHLLFLISHQIFSKHWTTEISTHG